MIARCQCCDRVRVDCAYDRYAGIVVCLECWLSYQHGESYPQEAIDIDDFYDILVDVQLATYRVRAQPSLVGLPDFWAEL